MITIISRLNDYAQRTQKMEKSAHSPGADNLSIPISRIDKHDDDGDGEDPFMGRMWKLHIKRRDHLQKTCCKYGECLQDVSKPHQHDFYCDRYKYTVCWIEKCSYSSWLRAT